MNVRAVVLAAFAAISSVTAPSVSAVAITIDDGCGTWNAGNLGGSLSADALGNLTLTGFQATHWVAGQGACEAPLPAGSTPRCTLTVSHTYTEPGGGVTLHARCRTVAGVPITQYGWTGPAGGPALPADAPGRNHIWMAFPSKGAYTFTVQGYNAYGWGGASTPMTVLVGNPAVAAEGPNCEGKFSPASIVQGQSSQFMVACQPGAAGIAWDSPEAGAPAAAGGAQVLTFPTPGTFTYKARAHNASGTYGPKFGATINVASNGSCVPGPYHGEIAAPTYAFGPDAQMPPNYIYAWSFSVAPGDYAYLSFQMHTAYNHYTFPNSGVLAVSKCRGDFNVPPACTTPFYNYYWNAMFPAIGSPYVNPAYCNLEPNTTYFLNIKPTDCNNSPTGLCGYRLYRQH